ncbi:MAG: O-antigen ligase domain-containing protein [Flavobacterium sp.]|nr:MAG: O-antigen ligase domain-containing protein [Flavobacterium sp.]
MLLHGLIAVLVFLFRSFAQAYFLFVIAYFIFRIFSNGNKNDEVLLAAAYITGFEVFSRMTGGVGISYEFAKFSVIGFMLIGMFFVGFTRKSWPYILFMVLLTPGILFSAINLDYDTNFLSAISFNLSGPICLAITALYCFKRKITRERFEHILLALLLPIISMAVYLFLYTPNIRDVLSGTHSNFAASGGYGPNQVATVLGLGMIILFGRIITIKSRFINILDLGLLAFVSYRGIITFSRGGIVTAAVCAAAFILVYFLTADRKEKSTLIPRIAFIAGVIMVTWLYSSISTLGLIDKRYSNQDAAGRVKEDVSTGRAELMKTELDAFYEAPFTGIGVGKVKEYRLDSTGIESATHNEVSRLFSEHGLFGLIALMVLVTTPLGMLFKKKQSPYLVTFLLFWLLTISHSSMRIAAPAFIYGLALIHIIHAKPKTIIHRK